MIDIGWIGCGTHAREMLLPHMPGAGLRIAALCDRDPHALAATGAAYGVARLVDDYSDLIATPGLAAVGMAVGPDLHHAAALAALEAGLPVFLEKPPARTAAGAREIAAASEATGMPVMVGFMKRYSTGNRIAMNILRGNDFGDVLGITGTYMTAPTYFRGAPDYTSFYLHHCIHYMDLVPWFLGEDFGDVTVRHVSPGAGRLLLHLNFTTIRGRIGNVVMGTVQSRGTPMEEIRIMGEHTRIHVDNIVDVTLYRDPPFKARDPDAALDPACDTLSWTPNFTAAANEDHKGYAALLCDVAAVLGGADRNVPRITDGVAAMERLERLMAAVGTR
jgi:myo-inositol 2-dehydrogenase/D-chiro-inositol 1-dehydrogenase